MIHEIRLRLSRQVGTISPMHVKCQQLSAGWLLNMHGRHPEPTKGSGDVFDKLSWLLLAAHAHIISCRHHGLQIHLFLSL